MKKKLAMWCLFASAVVLLSGWTAKKASFTVEGEQISIKSNGVLGGISEVVPVTPGRRVLISFEARGTGAIAAYAEGGRVVYFTYFRSLTLHEEQWRKFSAVYFEPSDKLRLHIYSMSRTPVEFQIRDFKAEPEPEPEWTDTEVEPVKFEAEEYPGNARKIADASVSGKFFVSGKNLYRPMMKLPVPMTLRPLYYYLRLKKESSGEVKIRLASRDYQELAEAALTDSGKWCWVRLGPVDARQIYPEAGLIYYSDPVLEVKLDCLVLSTSANLSDAQLTEGSAQ